MGAVVSVGWWAPVRAPVCREGFAPCSLHRAARGHGLQARLESVFDSESVQS